MKLNENSNGNIDKLYSLFDKSIQSIEKAQHAILDAAESLDPIWLESQAIGGKIGQLVPQHIKNQISKLTDIAESLTPISSGDDQSSIKSLKDLVENMPYRDIKPETPEQRRNTVTEQPNISAPDLSQGPQSKISESNEIDLEDFYKSNKLNEQEILYHGFSFDQLQESNIFGKTLDPDMMSFASSNKVSLGKYTRQSTQKLREKIESSDEDEDEKLNESFDPLTFRSPGIGSMGGLTMSSLKE